jgi:exopolysaccharide biosynthesis polyprenyl glycosylphosphotransferase
MKLLIAFVNYKSTDLLAACLDTIRQQPIDTEYQIVVVDNNSQDGGTERLQQGYPDITVIANTTNEGYAKAVNQAIRASESEYILLLNPDIEVTSGAIDAMVQFMETAPDVGIVGGKLLNPDGTLQHSCRTFYTLPIILWRRTFLGRLFPRSRIVTRHLMSDWDHNSVRDVDWVLGACMMIRRNALQAVGLMDERFFMYFEDVDWCYRMKKGGWRVCYVPDATMIHHHQRQSAQGFVNKTLLFHIMSMFHFYDKWGSLLYIFRKYRAFWAGLLFLILDLLALNVSFYGAHLIRQYLLSFLKKPHTPFFYYQNFLLFIDVVLPLIFISLSLYKTRRGELWVDELFRVGKGMLVGTLLLMAGSYLVQGYIFSRSMILTFAVLCTLLMFTFRWSAMAWYNSLHRQGFNLQRAIIVGTGQSAAIVQYELHKHREIGFDIVGFVRDPAELITQEESQVFPILGDIGNLLDILKAQNIHELIIATPSDSREMIARCKREGVNVRLVTDLQSLSMQEMEFEELAGIPIVYFQANPLLGLNLFLKRTMDILLSSFGLLLLSPIFAVISVLIKWESRGPVIFKQERIGRHGKPFTFYKFRSMCDQAEHMKEGLQAANEATGPLFKIRDDPRITRVGRFLRRYSLDEWPQLVNVLTGDMSLVGPRPAVPREVEQYSAWAAKRLDIRPGITGLWQVSGRSDLPFDEMLKLDIYYIWNWSLSNDLKILLRTIPVVLSGKGAY